SEGRVGEETPASAGLHDRLIPPVGPLEPIADMGVHRGYGAGTVLVVAGWSLWVAQLNGRNEPVPVQHGDVVVVVGRGVPAQEVIVEDANLAWGVVVANIVVIGLGKRHVEDADNQQTDTQMLSAAPIGLATRCHDFASVALVARDG